MSTNVVQVCLKRIQVVLLFLKQWYCENSNFIFENVVNKREENIIIKLADADSCWLHVVSALIGWHSASRPALYKWAHNLVANSSHKSYTVWVSD